MDEKRVAILQSNYIPWKGYFDIINKVDLFIFHDDLQYTKDDWRNRNKIKTNNGVEWLSIPCGRNEKRLICEVDLKDIKWQKKHWNKIYIHYNKTRYFNDYENIFKEIYLNKKWQNLSDINQFIIKEISHKILGIKTEFDDSRKYNLKKSKSDRVIELLKKVDATLYLSGPSAKNYLDVTKLKRAGIEIEWMDYSGYPEYKQCFPPFEHSVTMLDLIFNEGPDFYKLMKSFKGD